MLLGFYPFTCTGLCEGELCRLRDGSAGLELLVLSDFWPRGEVAKAYGIFNDEFGCTNRATFLIGADGTVVDTFGTDSLGTPREADRYAGALGKL